MAVYSNNHSDRSLNEQISKIRDRMHPDTVPGNRRSESNFSTANMRQWERLKQQKADQLATIRRNEEAKKTEEALLKVREARKKNAAQLDKMNNAPHEKKVAPHYDREKFLGQKK